MKQQQMIRFLFAGTLVMFGACGAEPADEEAPVSIDTQSTCDGPKCDAFDPGDRIESPDVNQAGEDLQLSGNAAQLVADLMIAVADAGPQVDDDFTYDDVGQPITRYSFPLDDSPLVCDIWDRGGRVECNLLDTDAIVIEGGSPEQVIVTLSGGSYSGATFLSRALDVGNANVEGLQTPIECVAFDGGHECYFDFEREVEPVEPQHEIHLLDGYMVGGGEPAARFVELIREASERDLGVSNSEIVWSSGQEVESLTAAGIECAVIEGVTEPSCDVFGVDGATMTDGAAPGSIDVVFWGGEASGAHGTHMMVTRLNELGFNNGVNCSDNLGKYTCGFTYGP